MSEPPEEFKCGRCGQVMATVDSNGTWVFKRCRCYYAATMTAVRDLCWKATQYGETEDGDTAAYIIPKGAVHRLVAAAQADGFSVALRAGGE